MSKCKDFLKVNQILCKEVFHSLFSNTFFLKKRNRLLFYFGLLVVYVLYFALNLTELNDIQKGLELGAQTKRMLTSSLLNVTLILCGLFYILVELTFRLTTTSQYILTCTPFDEKTVAIAIQAFKMFVSYAFFLLAYAILGTGLSLVGLNALELVTLQVMLQILYFAFYFIYVLFSVAIKNIAKYVHLSLPIDIFMIGVFLFLHSFRFRVQVDSYIGNLEWFVVDQTSLLALLLLSIIVLLLVTMLVYFVPLGQNETTVKINYRTIFKIRRMNNFTRTVAALLREKSALIYLSVPFGLGLVAFLDTKNLGVAIETSLLLYMAIGFIGLRYYSTTIKERILFDNYNFSVYKEVAFTSILSLVLNSVVLLGIYFINHSYIETFIGCLLVFEITLLCGALFPKLKSAVNELASSILSLIVIAIAFVVYDDLVKGLLALVFVVGLKAYFFKKGELKV